MSWTADSTVITADSTAVTADGWAPTAPIEPVAPTEPPGGNYTGGASRGRMIRRFRKRKREDKDDIIEPAPVDLPPPALGPKPPPLLPPQPGLIADMPASPPIVLASPPDEDEDEVALLLELLS